MNYIKLLKDNVNLNGSEQIVILYKHDTFENDILEEKYQISKVAGNHDMDKVSNLLTWVNTHIHHTGNYDSSDMQDALMLLNVAFKKDYGINCLSMSIVLCECLLAVNVKARVMYMMPFDAEDGDNHVVVEAYIREQHKWVMVDPTYGSYCVDSDGNILNLYEIRQCIIEDKEYYFSDTLNYNGEKVEDIEDLKNYYAKNLFFLRCKSVQGYGMHREYGNMLDIAPIGFDVHERMMKNLKYRIVVFCQDLVQVKMRDFS